MIKSNRLIRTVVRAFTNDIYAEAGSISYLNSEGTSTSIVRSDEYNEHYGYGLLLNDVVYVDLRTRSLNYPNEVTHGGIVNVMTSGEVIINNLPNNIKNKATCGTRLYITKKGKFSLNPRSSYRYIGLFLSKVDSDGFIKLLIHTY